MTAGVERFGDVSEAALAVAEAAVDLDASLFLFLGDLSNPSGARSYRAIASALKIATFLFENGVASLWLTGNHDVIEDGHGSNTLMPIVAAGRGTVAACARLYSVGQFDILCLPFTPRSHAYDPEEEVVKAHAAKADVAIIAGHLCIAGTHPGSETADMPRGREVMFPYDTCRKLYPNAVLLNGHYHEQQVFRGKSKRLKQGIHIPGSLERMTFGEEDGDKGFLVIGIDDGNKQTKATGQEAQSVSGRNSGSSADIAHGPA
tara:strand:- start:4229 stop:5011 length:783 start_codon:yes stop_codon:yes gene_type:complete